MEGDWCHHGVLGNIFTCQLCLWPWQHRGVLPTEVQARGGQESNLPNPPASRQRAAAGAISHRRSFPPDLPSPL